MKKTVYRATLSIVPDILDTAEDKAFFDAMNHELRKKADTRNISYYLSQLVLADFRERLARKDDEFMRIFNAYIKRHQDRQLVTKVTESKQPETLNESPDDLIRKINDAERHPNAPSFTK